MRVLVAGATGNLGRALIPTLRAHGHEVYALSRPGSVDRLDSFQENIAKIVTAEITNPDIPKTIFYGVHAVVSCIGITRQRDGLTYEQVDYQANLNLLKAAENQGVERFAYVSVIGADRDANVPVIRAKRRFENTLMQSGLEWQIVRPSGFFTDLTDVYEMARKGTIHLFGNGEAQISPIHPGDLAEAIADLIHHESGTITSIGGPRDYTWNEIAKLCFKNMNRRKRIVHWPEWTLNTALAVIRPFSKSAYGNLSFLGYVMTHDTTAQNLGKRDLQSFLECIVPSFKPEEKTPEMNGGQV